MLLKTAKSTIVLLSLLLISACAPMSSPTTNVEDGPVSILGTLSGDLPVNALIALPEGQQDQAVGYFSKQEQLDALLPMINTDGRTLPAVDFSTQIVLFTKNTVFYNRLRIGQVLREGGTVSVLAMETRSAMPITEKVAISLVIIEREGVQFIDARGKKIAIVD